MISIEIPGFGDLRLAHLVCDYNGTLAHDGRLLPNVRDALVALSSELRIHVVTADTFGHVARELADLPLTIHVLGPGNQAAAKRTYVAELGAESVVALGNGRNDREMLSAAALGIGVVQREGAAAATLSSADAVFPTAIDALEALRNPKRLVATLRE